MSAELIAILALGVTNIISMLAGFRWVVHRMDSRIEALETRLGPRIERV